MKNVASPRSEQTIGLLYTTAAFLLWGLSPAFWKLIDQIDARELLAHRIVWCGVILVGVLSWQQRWGHLPGVLRGRTLLTLFGTTLLISLNWFIFISAMGAGKILLVSLGYFMNPLISVVLGMIFLGERLRRLQAVAVALAAVGVLVLTLRAGELPWISLILAFSFGFYALLRKKVAASPEEGLAVETWLLLPLAVLFLLRLETAGTGSFGHVDLGTHVLLFLTGAITAAPLIWFTHGARRLTLTTVGLLQYLAPSFQFLLAVFVYLEPFALPQLAAFLFIWTALVIFTFDAHAHWRSGQEVPC